ncbi:cobalt/nickel transport system permease protein [Rhodobacter sp. JA431]|uniref:cobalt ECF transporter T component CbiQ n=1 Tax=Rhodobacter sp. JA431 TaxID=570013 RepID=UPI000BDC0337|nr:cobalt ECF transporter T component CbiQ [Rhodobacter sp. JA431]SOB89959.1 cobalt/nickel transport system permease protein [Rhodobacter sp. JA431]
MTLWPKDLRARLLAGFTALLCIAPLPALVPALAALVLVLALYLLERRALPWRRLLHLEAFLLLVLITVPFALPGKTLLALGPFTASLEGLLRALTLVAKVTASVLLLSALFAETVPEQLGRALRDLRVPEPLVRIFLGLVRYLALIRGEMARLQQAMRARSFRPGTNLHTWRAYGWLIGMMLLRALARADRVEEAMRLRHYVGRLPHGAAPLVGKADLIRAIALPGAFFLILIWGLI